MSSKTIDEAIILAGGLGTRLNPLTKNRPKPLVPVGNIPMLDWNFSALASNGIKRAIVVVGYLGNQIRNHINKFTSKIFPEMDIIIPNVHSKGTADALRVVSNHVSSDNFFVTMSDIVTNIDLKSMGSFHIKKDGLATISLKSFLSFPKRFGVVMVDESSKIQRFLEKPRTANELYYTKMIIQRRQFNQQNLINSGVYCFKSQILSILDEYKEMNDFGKDVFPYLLREKVDIFGYKSDTDYYWQDCGCPDQLLWTNLEILREMELSQENWPCFPLGKDSQSFRTRKKGTYPNVILKKPVIIGNNVQIKTGSKIHLSSINDNSKIGRNCVITGSTIWENVKIGNNVKIKNSIISDNVFIGNNSIIEDGTVIPSGKVIASNSWIRKGKAVRLLV